MLRLAPRVFIRPLHLLNDDIFTLPLIAVFKTLTVPVISFVSLHLSPRSDAKNSATSFCLLCRRKIDNAENVALLHGNFYGLVSDD